MEVQSAGTTVLIGESEENAKKKEKNVVCYEALSGEEFFSESDSDFMEYMNQLEDDVMRWG